MSQSKFRSVFKNSHVVLPVIHVKTTTQAVKNARIAVASGVDGVWVINQGSGVHDTLDAGVAIRKEFPSLWIGLNLLGLEPVPVIDTARRAEYQGVFNGIWCDDSGLIKSSSLYDIQTAAAVAAVLEEIPENFLYFGGVEHKGSYCTSAPHISARVATLFVDVITTSGPGTGRAADIRKIGQMRKGAGEHPLGIASGITPENVTDYLPYIDAFLVATGVSVDDHNFDEAKLGALVVVVRQYDSDQLLRRISDEREAR